MKRTYSLALSRSVICLMFVLSASSGLAGCSQGKTLDGSEREAVLAYSEPAADNLFQGLNANDYATFSRDFNDQMSKGIPEANFTGSLVPTIIGKLGKYVSRQVESVTEIGGNILVIYTARFEKDEKVTIRFSLEKADPHHVAGLYFNSPLLNQ